MQQQGETLNFQAHHAPHIYVNKGHTTLLNTYP